MKNARKCNHIKTKPVFPQGNFGLTSNTALSSRDLVLKYKQLWMVEAMFRSMKSLLETHPIYHKCDEIIRGHVFCLFLALLLRKKLQDRLEARGWHLEWGDIIHDPGKLQETEISMKDQGYIIRSESQGVAGKVTQACGVALPPVLRPFKAKQ